MSNLKNYLFELSSENAASGAESRLTAILRLLSPIADKITTDSVGNIIAFKQAGVPGAKKLMLDAHIDEIGLMVSEIDDRGFLHVINHAGVAASILPAAQVTVLGKRIMPGVVASVPPHLSSKEERDKAVKIEDIIVDIGLKKETAEQYVSVGDFVVLRSSCIELANNVVSGKGFDNRASAAVVLAVLAAFSDKRPAFDIYAVFSAGEEFSGFGAAHAAFSIYPDQAIILDVTHASSPGVSKEKAGALGEGAMVGISPILNDHMTEALIDIAKQYKIPYQIEVMSMRTGTNADHIVMTKSGIQCAMLSIPLRYMHSSVETLSLDDMESELRILCQYIEKGDDLYE